MKTNRAKQLLNSGQVAIGTMIAECRSPEVARVIAAAGFDFFIIDNEHGSYTLQDNIDILRAVRRYDIAGLVRVPQAEYSHIARTLDCGAEGVMVPRVETRETVLAVIDAVKYPPMGRRGYGLRSIHTDFEPTTMPDAIAHMNANTMVIIQIESVQAVEHIDELLSVPGVDVALIGPADLSVSLGRPGQFDHPSCIEAYEAVIAGCQRHGVAASAHVGSAADMLAWHSRGMRCLMVGTDFGLLGEGARRLAQDLRAGIV
jgi:2-dehydro-3-deoxyglucarate aldolase/4-hydroxy-2-oxoheptanedioate aldolase